MFRRLIVALALLCLPSLAAAADVPYSGNLYENGVAANGTSYVQLAVYAVPTGGSAMHIQAESLTVVNGVFHTMLSASTTVWDGSDRWVGVSVNGGAELSPRLTVGWVPQAVYASLARKLSNPPLAGSNNNESIAFVTSTSWTKIDSVSFTTMGPGSATIMATGYVEPAGNGQNWGVQYGISPDEFPTVGTMVGFDAVSVTTRPTVPVALTRRIQVISAGPQKYYLWARMWGGAVQSLHHSAPLIYIFTPTP